MSGATAASAGARIAAKRLDTRAGTFNDWTPDRPLLDKEGNGVYSCRMMLEPGTYEYKFVVDGEWKLDSNNPNFAPNDLGTLNSVLVVESK